MSIELVAVIITGVVSTFDFAVNIATLCLTGRCKFNCCGVHLEHNNTETSSPQRNSNE